MNVLIVGGNRGIGRALVQGYLNRGDKVYATCRTTPGSLAESEASVISGIDVRRDEDAVLLGQKLNGLELDLVIVNAGVLMRDTLQDLSFDDIRLQIEVNALGPLRIAKALLPHLKAGSKLGIITSRMGSITDNTSGNYYGYRMSKAAVNCAGASLAADLKPTGIAVALLHPGYVKTDMTGGNGDVQPEFSAQGLMARMEELSLESTGGFWHAQGEPLPW